MMSPTINFRVLLLAVLPVTAVSIIFFGYFFKKQIDDIEANVIDRGKSLAVHLAVASEYGIFSGNMAILLPLVESALTENDIISITITNNQGIPLIQKTGTKSSPLTLSSPKDKRNHIFSQPIIQHTIDINDFEDTDHNIPPVIGWVIIEVSNELARKNKRNAIFRMLSITLLILVGSIFLATRISRHITKPVLSLTNAVNKIGNGNLDVSIETHSTGALLTLEKGVRSMLQSIRSSHKEDRNTIEQTTKKLRDSLELLEQQNTELTITRQQALSANQEKSTFLANISHEIKTPMNEILGFVKLLKNTNLTPEQTNYLYTIEKSVTSLLHVINNVFDYSEIKTGKISTLNIHFNLEECIEDALALVAPSAHEKGIEISSLYYDDTPKKLSGSSNRIQQTFINLISNAIKFSDRGTIMVRTMLESQKSETVKIKITITNQESGIPEKDKAIILNAFSQIDDNNLLPHDASGSEPASSKAIIKAMHGKIGIESGEKDKGFIFWFTFECQFKGEPVSSRKSEHLPYYNKSITLYDSNELTRISLNHAFQRLGFGVTECLDIENLCAPQGVSSMPDIYVLSINSHEATKTTTREFLEKHRNDTPSKILVIVSKSDPLTLKTLRDWGADACLSKPFRHADLEKKLVTIFRSPKNFYGQKSKTGQTYKPATLTRLDGLNILVAEDNAVNATLTETILRRAGAIPHIVGNGKEAVAAFNSDKFDVILMDIHMPEMNGVDAARKIRETGSPSTRIGIIGLTAASQSKNGPLSHNPDFDEILEKPIAVNAFLTAINYWTHAHKSPEAKKPAIHDSTDSLGIDKGLSMTLNEILLRELPEAKEKLQAAYDSGDSGFLREEIHRLLGGMAYCDFTKLHQLTLQYQVSLKTNKDTMDENFQQMIAEMERLLTIGNP